MKIRLLAGAAAALLAACNGAQPATDNGQSSQQPAANELANVAAAARPEPAPPGAPGARARSCDAEIGKEAAAELVRRCRSVSPATRPPCHPANPCELIRSEIDRSCAMFGDDRPKECGAEAQPPSPGPASPCRVQDGRPLSVKPLRAIGTEPFWAAAIDGRCVTYSHPEDQAGTRVWTRYRALPGGGGTWSGQLGGQRFELTARPEAGCSDGMSDKRYPYVVDLRVGGERRRGCAERQTN